jgi:catechol 2,3-dioxygenase-like lactoylglutathione lyase family enzyme
MIEVRAGEGPDGRGGRVSVTSLHTVLFCRDWEACVAFYRDALGFPVVYENRRFVELQVASGAFIGLLDAWGLEALPPAAASWAILSLRVPDLDSTRAALDPVLPGLPEIRRHPWGARLFEIRDPEGRRLEFWAADQAIGGGNS